MGATLFIIDFSLWYYTEALRGMLSIFFNFIWFTIHFFSMPLLVRTLVEPWKRMTDVYQGGGIEVLAETIVMNSASRVLGLAVRLVVLTLGFLALSVLVLLFFLTLIAWIFFPVILAYASFFSMTLIV